MILAVFAHPDDELFAGALLAERAGAGEDVVVVVATGGESGRSSLASDRPLSQVRASELCASCEALGLGPPIVLDLPDGQLSGRAAELEASLASMIEDRGPDVIVTTGADGVYGHLDHIAVTRAVDAVAGCDVLHTAFPAGLFDPVRAALRRVPGLALAPGGSGVSPTNDGVGPGVPGAAPDRPLGIGRESADLVVDVAPHLDRKREAIASHRSQLRDGVFLSRPITEHILAVEWYVRRAT